MNDQANHWQALIAELAKLPKETEWVEFKENNASPEIIGKNISALSIHPPYWAKNELI